MIRLAFAKYLVLAAFVVFVPLYPTLAATVKTRTIHSKAMHKDISANVIVPDSYSNSKDGYPVVYLLHGFGDNYGSWVKEGQPIIVLADLF